MARNPGSPQAAEVGNERWVSVDDVAAHVGVRKDSIYRWIESRGLPATKIGKLWKLKVSEVDVWMRAGGVTVDADQEPGQNIEPVAKHASTILIVDDEENTRETLRDFLSDQGFIALTAGDGLEALQVLRSNGHPRPDLILLDLGMPNMDGLGFLKEQRRDPTIAAIPILVITAEKSREISGTPVLQKPLDIARLVAAIRGEIG